MFLFIQAAKVILPELIQEEGRLICREFAQEHFIVADPVALLKEGNGVEKLSP